MAVGVSVSVGLVGGGIPGANIVAPPPTGGQFDFSQSSNSGLLALILEDF